MMLSSSTMVLRMNHFLSLRPGGLRVCASRSHAESMVPQNEFGNVIAMAVGFGSHLMTGFQRSRLNHKMIILGN